MMAKSVSLTSGIAISQACLARGNVVRSRAVKAANLADAPRADRDDLPQEGLVTAVYRPGLRTSSGGGILSQGHMRSAVRFRAYCREVPGILQPSGATAGPPAWPSTQAGFRAKIRKSWHNGELCASREAAVKLKTVLSWAAVAFLLWWVIQQPTSAAHLVHNIGTALSTAATGISSFISSI
jgi:hypothetical protein